MFVKGKSGYNPPSPQSGKRKITGYANRLLAALTDILEDPNATVAERIQAAKIALEALPMRRIPRKKTDKERAIIKALEGKKVKEEEQKKPEAGPPAE
jgi:hypothetical protein